MKSDSLMLKSFLTRFILQPPVRQRRPLPLPRRQAAVLVPIVAHVNPTLLLTRRASTLRSHAGQVAFPGGVTDSTDNSAIATALREAQEEVAIPAHAVQVIGVLPPVTSSPDFQVTPVVGILPAGIRWRPNAAEVESVFEMPLEEALRLSRYFPLDIQRAGQNHRLWLSWFNDYFIWGMTAGIIHQLSLQVANPG